MKPKIGAIYPWSDVQNRWGGHEKFLAKRDGRIICATLNISKNPFAPDVMVVGNKPVNKQRAGELCEQGGSIPIFLKVKKNQWRYAGRFKVASFVTDPAELRRAELIYGRGLTRLIFLQRANMDDDIPVTPDIDAAALAAEEGRKKLVRHLRRERNPGLVNAKKRAVKSATGQLACEACGFRFGDVYGCVAVDFCEVHHLKPLADWNAATITTLDDLAIICSNCHRIIHRFDPMPSVQVFKTQVKQWRP